MKEVKDMSANVEKEMGPSNDEATAVHCNGNGEHAKGADSDGSIEDEDLKNVSVPELIDKFENIADDQEEEESDEEGSAEYSLKVNESQEIPYKVDSTENLDKNEGEGRSIGGKAEPEDVVPITNGQVKDVEEEHEDNKIEAENKGNEKEKILEKELTVQQADSTESLDKDEGEGEERSNAANSEAEDVVLDINGQVNGLEEEHVGSNIEAESEGNDKEDIIENVDDKASGVQEDTSNNLIENINIDEEVPTEEQSVDDMMEPVIKDTDAELQDKVEAPALAKHSPPQDTFQRQNTYTVTTSTVCQSVLARQDTYVIQQSDQEDEDHDQDVETHINDGETGTKVIEIESNDNLSEKNINSDKEEKNVENHEELVEQEQTEKKDMEEVEQLEIVENSLEKSGENVIEYSSEPIYKEVNDEDAENDINAETVMERVEEKYVTAEEVRIQKRSIERQATSTTTTITATSETETSQQLVTRNMEQFSEQIVTAAALTALPLATLNLGAQDKEGETKEHKVKQEQVVEVEQDEVEQLESALLTKKEDKGDEEARRSQDVDQLLEAIRDPELELSAEEISALVEPRPPAGQEEQGPQQRVSPEFARAAGLLDKVGTVTVRPSMSVCTQNPDQGFDPEDPAVKGLEDWECSNNMDSVDSSLANLVS